MIKSKKVFNIVLIVLALASMLLGGCSMSSNNYVGREDSYSKSAPRKLGRGMTNFISAPLEIVNQPVNMAAETDDPAEQAAGYLGGFFVGIAYGAGRIVSGAYDIVTSPFGGPAAPTMDDEFVTSEFVDKVDARDEEYKDVSGLGD